MHNRFLIVFLSLALSLFSEGKILNYGARHFEDPFDQPLDYNVWKDAFNHAPELAPFFIQVQKDLKIATAIETGTWKAHTTKFFAFVFNHVDTIEIQPSVFQKAISNLSQFSNIQCHLGSSEVVLSQILPSYADQPLLFYLDAHWLEKWPLLDELDAISRTHRDNCVIVIDDFKVPGRSEFPYDAYANHECSFEHVKEKLRKVFSEYDSYYLLPKHKASRAKFVALPKKWNFRPE